jgi:hypothetical protein
VRGLGRVLLPLLAGLLLWPAMARAVDLTDFTTDDQSKKLHLEFSFSESVEAQVVNNYAGNFVDIGIAGLKVPRKLTRQDHEPDSEETANFYRFTRFMEVDNEQHIRIYLGKYADPSDVQVVPLDDKIAVEMVKPYWKLPAEEAAAAEEAAGEAGFIPDEAAADEDETGTTGSQGESGLNAGLQNSTSSDPAEDSGEAAESEGAEGQDSGQSSEQGEAENTEGSADTEGEGEGRQAEGEQAESATVGSGEVYGQTSLRDLSSEGGQAGDSEAGTANGASMQPVRSLTEGPSYQEFDLDDVPVAQVQLRNMPFNEALMELVAGTGFNVIVGSEVSNELMTLDFRQKELSLKRALDLLCMAYQLTYVVEDDAIIISRK